LLLNSAFQGRPGSREGDALARIRDVSAFGSKAPQGLVTGQEEERVPLSVRCLELLLADPRAFWDEMRHGEG
jgi:hypothetical protein